jgi:hypothetical protein
VTISPAFERVVLALQLSSDSTPPAAAARCVAASPDQNAFEVQVAFDGWLRDQLFSASQLTRTITLSGTTALKSLAFRVEPGAGAGATLVAGVAEPLPYRLAYEASPPRFVLDVAKRSLLGAASNPLAVSSSADARPANPIVYLLDGDIWTYTNGQATNLTNSPEVETALAVQGGGTMVAFCRAQRGTDAGDARATSTLWTMNRSGGNQQELATEGRTCAEPAFSPDGQTIAFTVNEGGATPPRLSIYTVPAAGGAARRLTSPTDEWSRFGPQWLDNNRLVYAAAAEDGRSTLFLARINGGEEDIGARLVVGDRYQALGVPLVAPDGSAIAVEGLRATDSGADLVILDTNGVERATVGKTDGKGFWQRPVAWGADNTLFYLSTSCASEVVQEYTLHARPVVGTDRVIAAGTTTGGFGQFRAPGAGLAYVTLDRAPAGPRGPLAVDRFSPSALWYWDTGAGSRARLVEAPRAIGELAP